jgi:hypothetical protein
MTQLAMNLMARQDVPRPVFKATLRDSLATGGKLALGTGENTRIARAMYWDENDKIYKYAETPLTAAENQLVSNSDFSARSYGYVEWLDNTALSGTGGTSNFGAGTIIGEWADDCQVYAAAGATLTVSKNGSDQQVASGSGGATLFISELIGTLTSSYHYLAIVEIEAMTGSPQVRISNDLQSDTATAFQSLSVGTNEIYFTATTNNAGQKILVYLASGESVTISEMSFKRQALSEANSRMTGTGSDVLDGDGDMSSDPTSDWGGSEATDSWGESSYLRYTFTTVNTNKGAYKGAALTPGQRYYITFKARTDRSCSGGFSSIGDNVYTGNEVSNPTLSSDWQDYAFYITPTGTDLRLYMEDGGSIGDTLDFDDVTIVPVEHDWENTGLAQMDVDDTYAGKLYMLGDGGNDYVSLALAVEAGHYYRVTLTDASIDSGGSSVAVKVGTNFSLSDKYGEVTFTDTPQTLVANFIAHGTTFNLGNTYGGLSGYGIKIGAVTIEEVTLDDYSVVGTLSADCYFKYLENDTVHAVRVGSAAVAYLQQDIGDADDWVQWSIVLSDVTGSMGVTTTGVSFGSFTASVSDQINQLKGAGIVAFFCAAGSNGIIESFTAYPVPQTQAFEDGWALFGAQAKNSALDSRGSAWEESANWSEGGGVGVVSYGDTAIGFDGVADRAITISTTASGMGSAWQGITIDADTNTHLVTLFIGKDEDETRFPELLVQLVGGVTISQAIAINTKTGAVMKRTGSNTNFGAQDCGDFWRVWTEVTNDGTQTALRAYATPAVDDGWPVTYDTAATGSAVFDQVDVYLNTSGWIPNPIVTESSEVTKDADLARWEMSADFKKLFANEYGTAVIDDDCADDDTANWNTANATLSFDTDHYVLTRVSNSFHLYSDLATTVVGQLYKWSFEYKDGTMSAATSYIRASNGSGNWYDVDLVNVTVPDTSSSWQTAECYFYAEETTSYAVITFWKDSAGNIQLRNLKLEPVTNLAQQTTVFKWKPGYDGVDSRLLIVAYWQQMQICIRYFIL